jgi:hypothetical protein
MLPDIISSHGLKTAFLLFYTTITKDSYIHRSEKLVELAGSRPEHLAAASEPATAASAGARAAPAVVAEAAGAPAAFTEVTGFPTHDCRGFLRV